MNLSRRHALAGAAALAASPLLATGSAKAAAPLADKQAPSFYRYKIGDAQVNAISDGANTFPLADAFVLNAKKDEVNAALDKAFLPKDKVTIHFAPLVINTGGKLVVIDTGNGPGAFAATKGNVGQFANNMAAAGIDASKVKWVVAEGSALPSLLANGRADAICQFSVGEPLIAAATAPKEIVRIDYKDSNLDYYGNGLIASEEMIAKNPEQVKAFVRATIKGMKDAFANPAEAAAIMAKYQKELSPAVIEGETRLVKELADVKGKPLGSIDPKSIAGTIDVMSANFTLKDPVKPADLFAPGFVE